ncbi:MAG TPA: sugar phosphate isomerase/epimerase family protein [Nitrososphaera sp.]|jgi:sugar phosphate isomerase/epimerase
MKYSISLASFRKIEPIESTLSKLASQGYDAVEMFGEPKEVDIRKLKDVFGMYDMPVCGITGMWGRSSEEGWKRKLLSSDQTLVQSAIEYVHDCVKLCNLLGGEEMNICLFADEQSSFFERTHNVFSQDEKERLARKAIPILAMLSKFASDYGVKLVLEPLNRYSTPHCSTARDALAIVRQVNSDSLGMLLDTFHMNIEEDSFEDAIRTAGKYLKHVHFADNNRKMPGFGHIDFATIVHCLQDACYDGYISFEPNIGDRDYEHATKSGLDFVRALLNTSDDGDGGPTTFRPISSFAQEEA